MDQFLEKANHLLRIFAIFLGLAKVKDKWQNIWWKNKTKVGIKPRWTVEEFCNKKQDKPLDKNLLWRNWSTIANSRKLRQIIKYVNEVLKRNLNKRLLFNNYELTVYMLLCLISQPLDQW